MYLNRLNPEQKELFLDLCIHAAMANGTFANDEKEMIALYCEEMQLLVPRYEAETDKDTAIEELKKLSTPQELRMILFEIAGLVLSDNICDEDEKLYINDFALKTGMEKACVDEAISVLTELKSVYSRIDAFVANS